MKSKSLDEEPCLVSDAQSKINRCHVHIMKHEMFNNISRISHFGFLKHNLMFWMYILDKADPMYLRLKFFIF